MFDNRYTRLMIMVVIMLGIGFLFIYLDRRHLGRDKMTFGERHMYFKKKGQEQSGYTCHPCTGCQCYSRC